MTKKIVSIGVPGYEVKLADKPEWFDHLIAPYANPCAGGAIEKVPVVNYFSNRPVATLHRKAWLAKTPQDRDLFLEHLDEAGWKTDPGLRKYETRVYTHPDHWGHEIVVIYWAEMHQIFNRFAMELNHE